MEEGTGGRTGEIFGGGKKTISRKDKGHSYSSKVSKEKEVLVRDTVDKKKCMIIVAVLVFGGLWGFWGVFFAIPLATLVKAVWNALPSHETETAS